MSETSMTPEWLAEIAARAAAATPGPWWTDTLTEHDSSESIGVDAEGDSWVIPCQDIDRADAEFIAHARADVPALLAWVAEMEAEREKLIRWHGEDSKTINGLVARVERHRARLVALQNDALSIRGSLAPADGPRAVPFELGETLTPAVDWLIARVAELETERHSTNEALDDAVQALREMRDRLAEQEAEREALAARLRAGQRWQRGRRQPLISQDYVSQDELRAIFGIALTAPWDAEETHVVADDSDDPEHVDDCPGCETQQTGGDQ